MKQSEQTPYRDLIAYAEGDVGASKAETIEKNLAASPENRLRLARVHAVQENLKDTASIDDVDLLPGLLPKLAAARQAMPPAQGRRFSYRIVGLAVAAAALAVIVPLFIAFRADTPDFAADEFHVKSAVPAGDARSRWIAFNAFRLSDDAEPEQVHDALHTSDGLLFSYTNLGPEPFSHMMIFGVDSKRRVFWYYPAFLDAADNPKSIPIDKGVSRAGLREVITHPYREGQLILFALFSDNILSVSDIETAVSEGVDTGEGFEATFDGVRAKVLTVKVSQ